MACTVITLYYPYLYLLTEVAFTLMGRRGALGFRPIFGEGIISCTVRPTNVDPAIADTLLVADSS
jgi:hypothetical protein